MVKESIAGSFSTCCALVVGLGLVLPPAARAQDARHQMRLWLPPFSGEVADPASGVGLSDLFGFCVSRIGRVRVLDGREDLRFLQGNTGRRGLAIEEATYLGTRHRAHMVLLVRYSVHEDVLTYEVLVGDLRRDKEWKELPRAEKPWSEAHRLHLDVVQEVLHRLDPPPLASEERRAVRACSRPFPSREAVALYGRARLTEWEGQEEAATHLYARAAEVASGFALPFFRQGELLEKLGDRWRAAGAYRRAIQADGRFGEAYKRLGDILADNPRRLFEQALEAYGNAVEIDPDYAEGYVGLGGTLAALGKVEEAIGAYQQGLRVDPWNTSAHLGLANIYHGEKGLFREAVAEYERALDLDPTFLEAHMGLGDLLEEKGLYHAAIDRYRMVLDREPTHPGALFAVARAYEKVNAQEAIARWEHYLAVARDLPSEREWLDIARGHLEKLRRLEQEKTTVH